MLVSMAIESICPHTQEKYFIGIIAPYGNNNSSLIIT